MAGEWIKVQSNTIDKPEVMKMARLLGIDRDRVFGKLVRVWCWFDENSVDGVVDGVVAEDIDAMVELDGFSGAMLLVGWLDSDPDEEKITLPNFDRHNGETAKSRALKNKRQARWRKNSVDAKPSTSASTREEKRREEYKYSQDDKSLAEYMYQKILDVMPKTKKPNFDVWANEIRLMRERDDIKFEEIRGVFDLANNDEFWATNILSPSKLRKQFPQLQTKLKPQQPKSNGLEI